VEAVGNGSLLVVDGCLLCLTYAGDLLLVKPTPSKFTKRAEIKGLVARDLRTARQAEKLNEPEAEWPYPYGDTDYAPCWAPPAVARGKVYICYSDRLVCYDLMEAGSREPAAAQNPDTGEAGNSSAKPHIATDRPPASANRYLPSKALKPASTAGAGTGHPRSPDSGAIPPGTPPRGGRVGHPANRARDGPG
jgi:hypothetical protein